ncbi:uncharacterized protein I303_101033 [Kwoniella dejecticola CBS 10117]|uniref:UDENN domain-containing protein n=1 Tax=Kwoniella dejecticola CBS 10117 TaxID=1296121 RepID=A0A1A6AGM3_9TREE|nr:uncharacterized protein I303_01036 [Kwoniella dejecticola CBS 10117]OBR89211.1 hypothetical protein I303_01036 [Kwoniella dejecticola CBS 10117]
MVVLPPLAAIFLTHFDDIKGQSVIFYASLPNLPAETIEHTTLPSGLHALDSDVVLFTHHELPGAGVFRSRLNDESARGRRMGTLGIVLADPSVPSDLFALHDPLSSLFDQLEDLDSSPFAPSTSTSPSSAVTLLAKVWHEHRADSHLGGSSSNLVKVTGKEAVRGIRKLVNGRADLPPEHPITYMPSLLGILGPSVVPVYKAALSGQRIILYSTPPLLPLAAFAWCIWSMSLAPGSAPDAEPSKWVGNVGLMDLTDLKARQGGWIATTSDAIYKSHHAVYDMFIDLSSVPLTNSASVENTPTPHIFSTFHQPKNTLAPVTYAFGDLSLYKSLLLLTSSPPTVHAGMSKTGGWWLLAFEVMERAWKLCVGVCEFAVGRGRVGEEGHLRLDEGEEDARLLGGEEEIITTPPGGEEEEEDNEPEDEAIRRGRLILRQMHHETYHLHSRLKEVIESRPRGEGSRMSPLTQSELRLLVGSRWPLSGQGESQFWSDIATVWGMTIDDTDA